jgi:hypothetical protein
MPGQLDATVVLVALQPAAISAEQDPLPLAGYRSDLRSNASNVLLFT